MSPNERYATLIEMAGYLLVALSARDYLELLPARWQAINAYGIRINHRTYDAGALNPLRRQPSGIKEKKDLWEVHHDPYDVSRVWVRDRDGGWITAIWKHLHRAREPFGELAWDRARAGLPEGTEEELADAVSALLHRAHHGPTADSGAPSSKRDRGVAATTRASSQPAPAPPGWRELTATATLAPELLTESEWRELAEPDRLGYDEMRLDYHTRLAAVATSTLRQVVHAGRRLTLLNRHAISARRGLILSGPAGTGKTTAITQFGETHQVIDPAVPSRDR